MRIGGGRGSESGAQKAPPRRGEGRVALVTWLPWLPDCLITAGLSLPPHYHRQGYCCDYCYYGDDDGYDGQTAAGGGAGGSGTTGLPRSAIRAGSADRAGSAIRTGGSDLALGADGTARSVVAVGSGSTGRPGGPGAPGLRQRRQARQLRERPAAPGGADCEVAVRLNSGFQPAKFPCRMGLGGVHIVDLEGYPAGGAADLDCEFSSGGYRG